jgi:hypothetical protein
MRPIMILAALAILAAAPGVHAQTLDKNGRCHDAAGKFAKADVCKGSKGTTTAAAGAVTRAPVADAKGPYKLDTKGKCHDAKGKMAAKAKCA